MRSPACLLFLIAKQCYHESIIVWCSSRQEPVSQLSEEPHMGVTLPATRWVKIDPAPANPLSLEVITLKADKLTG
jgi:hypothetical protein